MNDLDIILAEDAWALVSLVLTSPSPLGRARALTKIAKLRKDMAVVRWPGPSGRGAGTAFGIRVKGSAHKSFAYGYLNGGLTV